jgi:Replication initiator protein A
LATIYDRDIHTLHLNAHELLVWSNRETSGDGYRRLKEAFERLSGTRITTNIRANSEEITEGFGLIESRRVVRETRSRRMSELMVRVRWLGQGWCCREQSSLMRTVSGTSASDGLGEDCLGLFGGAWLTAGINFREVFSQLLSQLMLLVIGEGRGFNGAHADRLVVQHMTAEESLDGHFLFGG